MSTVAAFTDAVIDRENLAWEERPAEIRFRWPPQRDLESQATSVATFSERKDWLIAAYKNLSTIAALNGDWDSYGAEAPNGESVGIARYVLHLLDELDFEPSSIDPSAEGGICLSFQHGDRYSDVECFNSGEILAVTSSGDDDTNVWETGDSEQDLRGTLSRIRTFVGR